MLSSYFTTTYVSLHSLLGFMHCLLHIDILIPPKGISDPYQLQPHLCTDHSEICTFTPTLLLSSGLPCTVSAYCLHLCYSKAHHLSHANPLLLLCPCLGQRHAFGTSPKDSGLMPHLSVLCQPAHGRFATKTEWMTKESMSLALLCRAAKTY